MQWLQLPERRPTGGTGRSHHGGAPRASDVARPNGGNAIISDYMLISPLQWCKDLNTKEEADKDLAKFVLGRAVMQARMKGSHSRYVPGRHGVNGPFAVADSMVVEELSRLMMKNTAKGLDVL